MSSGKLYTSILYVCGLMSKPERNFRINFEWDTWQAFSLFSSRQNFWEGPLNDEAGKKTKKACNCVYIQHNWLFSKDSY